jgi:hypothetical protein
MPQYGRSSPAALPLTLTPARGRRCRTDHAAAVETGFGVLAAEAVTGIDQAEREDHHVVGFFAAGRPCRTDLAAVAPARRRAAAGHQQQRNKAGDKELWTRMVHSINCSFSDFRRLPCILNDPRLLRSSCYIDGRWEAADDGRTLVVIDPATARFSARCR